MTRQHNKTFFIIVFGLALLAPVILMAGVSKEQKWDFTVSDDTKLSISNVNGDISIRAAGGGQLLVTAKLKADSEEDLEKISVVVTDKDGHIEFETKHGKSISWFNWGDSNSGEVEYTIHLPTSVPLESIATVNGDVMIAGAEVSSQISTVNGDLELSDISGNVALETVNGDISVKFLSFNSSQSASVQTVNGSVVVYLPADASTTVKAETVNGKIRATDFNLDANEGRFVGSSLKGDIGGGSASLLMETVNGSIKVKSSDG